jgi:hypothetical protein
MQRQVHHQYHKQELILPLQSGLTISSLIMASIVQCDLTIGSSEAIQMSSFGDANFLAMSWRRIYLL